MRSVLRSVICAAALTSCDMPAEPVGELQQATLAGTTIETRVGEWFNVEAILQRRVSELAPDGPFTFDGNDFAQMSCDAPGNWQLRIRFVEGDSAQYTVRCIRQVTLVLSHTMNLDQEVDKDVDYITQSNGIITSHSADGDVIITCTNEGSGTLWIFYSDGTVEYADLYCIGHDQGAGG